MLGPPVALLWPFRPTTVGTLRTAVDAVQHAGGSAFKTVIAAGAIRTAGDAKR
jgi:hypothetical protein